MMLKTIINFRICVGLVDINAEVLPGDTLEFFGTLMWNPVVLSAQMVSRNRFLISHSRIEPRTKQNLPPLILV